MRDWNAPLEAQLTGWEYDAEDLDADAYGRNKPHGLDHTSQMEQVEDQHVIETVAAEGA